MLPTRRRLQSNGRFLRILSILTYIDVKTLVPGNGAVAGARPGGGQVYGDGSWQLTIFVTDLQVERSLRVRGDTHIGGVMIKLVDSLGQ